MPGPTVVRRPLAAVPSAVMHPSYRSAFRELLAAALWIALGASLYATGIREPVRAMLLWGGALPISWGMTRAVFALWHLVRASRRGS